MFHIFRCLKVIHSSNLTQFDENYVKDQSGLTPGDEGLTAREEDLLNTVESLPQQSHIQIHGLVRKRQIKF